MFDRLVDVLIGFIDKFAFWVVIEPWEAGVLTRLGRFNRVLDPGFHWVIPLGVDHIQCEHTVPTTHSLNDQSVTTADGKHVGFQAVITYKVRDIKAALLDVEDGDHAIRDACAGTIAHTISRCTWDELVESEDWMNRVLKACRQRGFKFGLEITDVQFATFGLVKMLRLLNQ